MRAKFNQILQPNAVQAFANKSATKACSLDFVTFQATIKPAACAASRVQGHQFIRPCRWYAEPSSMGSPGFLDFDLPGGCVSRRLDHGLNFFVIRGGFSSSRLINKLSDCKQRGCVHELGKPAPKGAQPLIFSNIWQLARPNSAKSRPLRHGKW